MSSTTGKVIHCKAAVLWTEGEPMTIEDITVDPPQRGEVRVRNISAGICASDAHFLWKQETELKLDFKGLPVVLGHEGAGVVESVGEGVSPDIREGDKIIPLFLPNCSRCDLCRNPMTNLCESANFESTLYHSSDGETRLKVNGRPLLSFCGTSTFSEYSVLRESQVCKVSPDLDLNNACIIGCAVGTGFATAQRLAKVHAGSTCAVWGLGAIGLSTVLACKQSGAKHVIGIDVNPEKEKFAPAFGCTEFLEPKNQSIVDHLWDKYQGIDYAFDCIGNIEVLRTGYKSLRTWGTLVAVGLGPSGHSLDIKVGDVLKGKRVIGGYFGNQKSREVIEELSHKYLKGELNIDSLITHRFQLKDINEAFDCLRIGKSIRSVIQF